MATRRFCDICDQPLTPEDDQPFVRELEYTLAGDRPEGEPKSKAVAAVAIVNEENHPLTDVCSACKLKVVTDGHAPAHAPAIATLQPRVAADTPVAVMPFRLPAKPPKVLARTPAHQSEPPIRYEPSLPVHDQ